MEDRYGGEDDKRGNVSLTIRKVIGASSMARILIPLVRRISRDIIYRHIVSNEIRMKLKKRQMNSQ